MKKTLFSLSTLFALSAGIVQADTSLRYHYDFEKISGTSAGTAAAVNYNLAEDPGTGMWTASSGWVNWTGGALGSSYAFNYPGGGAKLTLQGSGTGGSLGVNTTDGFSMSFFVKDNGSAQYANMFQLNSSNGNRIFAQKDNGSDTTAGAWQFYSGSQGGLGNWASTTVPLDGFAHIALTFQNGTLQVYRDGNRFLNATNVDFSGDLTSIALNPGGAAAFDEFALYSGVLNQEEISYLATHSAKDFTIPEPTTATLGLAGFALLALRRRRHAA